MDLQKLQKVTSIFQVIIKSIIKIINFEFCEKTFFTKRSLTK